MDTTVVNNKEGSPPMEQVVNGKVDTAEASDEMKIKRGGWRTAPYIFGKFFICMCVHTSLPLSGAAAVDFFASFGIMMNLLSYLQGRLNMELADAANVITSFMGMCSYTPLVGAFVADAYIGRYKTILVSSIVYVMGLVVLVAEAKLSVTRPPQCKDKDCLGYLYAAFVILAIASGGIRPNAPSFGADQFDQKDPVERKQLFGYFNWYYFFIVVAILNSSTLLIYIQNRLGWGWGYGIPAITMLFSTVVFWAGSPLYRRMVPAGSPFTRLAQVAVAAYRKRNLDVPSDPSTLHETKHVEQGNVKLHHTMQFRFLDKAAIAVGDEDLKPVIMIIDSNFAGATKINPWKLCEVSQVEELKSLLRMAPVWATGIPIFIAWSQQSTFWAIQAYFMDRHMGNTRFQIPYTTMPIFAFLTMLTFLPIYDRFLVPLAKKATGNPRGITFLQRIGIGIIFAAVAMMTAGLIEVRRRNQPVTSLPTCFWLVPQYCFLGLSEAFVTIGYLEFFYDQSPPSMRSMAAAVVWAIIGTGNYLSTLIVYVLKKYTSNPAGVKNGWLADNINVGRLEYFYWLLAGFLVLDFGLHLLVAYYYKYTKPDYGDDDEVPVVIH